MPFAQQIKVPLIAVNDTSLTVVAIPFKHGDLVKKGDILLVFETSKTTYDAIAEVDGFIEYQCELDGEYEVNEVVANIYPAKNEVPAATPKPSKKMLQPADPIGQFTTTTGSWDGETLFSAAAIKLMLAKDLNRELFKGRDFVSRADVEQQLAIDGIAGNNQLNFAQTRPVPLLPIDAEKVTVEKLSTNKRKEIAYLGVVQSAGLTSTINTIVETGGIFVYINQSLRFLKDSLLPVIIYETARLLVKYPTLNGYFTGDSIAIYKEIDIGFAIDAGKGLKVLRLSEASSKMITEIEQDIMTLSNKYLDGALSVEELTGVSFTITDLSAEGVSFFTPLVNMMNSAILGVSAIDKKLNRCVLSVTFDHRVTEGKLVAQFLNELKDRLESYRSKYHPDLNLDIECFKCFKKLKEDLSDVGFTRCITPKGAEAYICQSCLKGF